MATFLFERQGGDLKISKDGQVLPDRLNIYEIDIKIDLSTLVFFPNGLLIDFASNTVTGFANPEELADQLGVWLEEANKGQ